MLPKDPIEASGSSSILEISLLASQNEDTRDAVPEPLVPASFVGAVKDKATPAPKGRAGEAKLANVR